MTARADAELLLGQIIAEQTRLQALTGDYQAQIAEVDAYFTGPIAACQDHLAGLAKRLEDQVRTHRQEILGEGDRADLRGGSVMLKREARVKRIRTMLEAIKAAGLLNLSRMVETVDWDAVERLPDEDLEALGTRRVVREHFEYTTRSE